MNAIIDLFLPIIIIMRTNAYHVCPTSQRVNSIRKTDATEIRPRKATYKDTGAAAELRELIDRKVRVISATLDQTIQDLDSVSENAEAVATEMQHVKVRNLRNFKIELEITFPSFFFFTFLEFPLTRRATGGPMRL